MRALPSRAGAAAAVLALFAQRVIAVDSITLSNGRVIEADRAWFEGAQLLYEKGGGVFGLPRSLVASVTSSQAAKPDDDTEVALARELSKGGRDQEALQALRATLAGEPRNLQALQALAETSLRSGDPRSAADAAQKAVQLNARDPRSHELLGDAQAALGNPKAAAGAYRASLRIAPSAQLERKLEAIEPRASPRAASAPFRLRYEGSVDERLGFAVLESLHAAFAEYSQRLGYTPPEPVTVVLQTESDFQHGGAAPVWAASVYDGTLRIPVKGVEPADPHMRALLRHELAHSFLTSRTGGNCPTWIQEGVAQWLEGGDPARNDARLAQRARSGTLFPLLTLEAPFQDLAESDLPVAYSESLSGIAHLLRLRTEAGLVRLLAALGDGLPSEEALPVAIGMSYGEFQRDWEIFLRGADRR